MTFTIKRENWKFTQCWNCGVQVNCEADWSKWFREKASIDSRIKGYSIYDLDAVLEGKTRQGLLPGNSPLMILEVKGKMAEVDKGQDTMLRRMAQAYLQSRDQAQWFMGTHYLQFENWSPLDGRIFFDAREVTAEELESIVSFQASPGWYLSNFNQVRGGLKT